MRACVRSCACVRAGAGAGAGARGRWEEGGSMLRVGKLIQFCYRSLLAQSPNGSSRDKFSTLLYLESTKHTMILFLLPALITLY